jgi:hypothetical protein
MSATEWILAVLVILIPAIIATMVTLWTLEQARLRSRKNRRPSGQGSKRDEVVDSANRRPG